jgi:hypothetical protein
MAFWPRRDNETVSEAKATLAETKDLSTLSRIELAELHRCNPEDTTVILNWAFRSTPEPGGIREDCREAFMAALPRMLAEQEIGPIATALSFIAEDPKKVQTGVLLSVAARLERVPNPVMANQFYDMVQKHPDATDDDLQASAFRIAMLAEASFNDYERAWAWYQHVLDRWPMGHLAPQAKSRLEVLAKKASATV